MTFYKMGWVYEGWVAGPDGPVSTGRFKLPNETDSDGAGPMAGAVAAPPFPGQDFVNPAISIEPDPDNRAVPFALEALVTKSIGDTKQGGVLPAMEKWTMAMLVS